MNRPKLYILATMGLLFSTYFVACKKDPVFQNYQTTPYELEVPKFFLPFLPVQENELTQEGVALGRFLFYDPILSDDGSQSCASCHNQQFAFTDNELATSVGIKGIAGNRNSMPLFNLNWHDKGFFWDGRSPTLRDQILEPIEDPIEMASTVTGALERINGKPFYRDLFYKAFGSRTATSDNLAKAIEQFMLTFVSSNSRFDKGRRGELALTQDELDGLTFTQAENDPSVGARGGDCFHCHGTSGELFSDNDYKNNGLDETLTDLGRFSVTGLEKDKGKFKTPSLRNLSFTAPFMHDGRFKTIEEVLDHYGEHVVQTSPNIDPNMNKARSVGQIKFTPEEKRIMLAFLKSLDDYELISNPAFSDPFTN